MDKIVKYGTEQTQSQKGFIMKLIVIFRFIQTIHAGITVGILNKITIKALK